MVYTTDTESTVVRAEALELLASASALDRLRAARLLQHIATTDDKHTLERSLAREPDAWVRSALTKAVRSHIDEQSEDAPSSYIEDSEGLKKDVRAQTTQEMISMITHELDPLVGTLRRSIRDEIPNFRTTDTYRAISSLDSFLAALSNLYQASNLPSLVDFSLSDLVFEVTRTVLWERQQRKASSVPIGHARRDHVGIISDPGLVRLAFLNVLRNAVEASDPDDGGKGHPILVNWGSTDRDMWIAIFDRGVGLPSNPSGITKPGVTTKKRGRHTGMGLTIATMALLSMNGKVAHRPRRGGGVVSELRWT